MNKICEQVRDLLAHDRGNLNFSPASRYAVQKLIDYAEQEHEQREKAETMLCNERRKALAFSAEMARQERTIDDLRQQLSFLQQAMQDAGVRAMPKRINPRRRPATQADVQRAKDTATADACRVTLAIFFTALLDKEGMDADQLQRIWREVEALSESVRDGYVSAPDLIRVLRDEYEIDIVGG